MCTIRFWVVLLPALNLSACMAPGPFPQAEPEPLFPNTTDSEQAESTVQAPVPAPAQPSAEQVTSAVGTQAGGPTSEQQAILDDLRNWGPAPELTNEVWLNSPPLTLADLRGRVVLVEFWTFGCINCRNVLPSMREWYARYKDLGLEIVGVHTPEFSYEKDVTNVQNAVAELGVEWPVAIDNDWTTWRSYNNRYWPAMYVVDKTGNVRHLKIGEGQYEHTEAILQALLAEQP